MIAKGIRDHGGSLAVINMPEFTNLTPKGAAFRDHGNWWKRYTTNAILDYKHGQSTRGNFARLYLELYGLWNTAKTNEVNVNKSYSYVMIFRDDANWLADFDLERLLRTGGFQKNPGGSAGRAFVHACRAFSWKSVCDYVVVAERDAAEPFGSFYDLITDPGSMGKNLNPGGCPESETYLYQVAMAFHVRLEVVPIALIPFQRCGRVNLSGTIVPCLHKACDHTFEGVPLLGATTLVPAVGEKLR